LKLLGEKRFEGAEGCQTLHHVLQNEPENQEVITELPNDGPGFDALEPWAREGTHQPRHRARTYFTNLKEWKNA
jgi:hypothetical protein